MNKGMASRDFHGLMKIVLGFTFPFFFLIHWNGFLSFIWYEPLKKLGLETYFLAQMLASLLSAAIIFNGLFPLIHIVIGWFTASEDPAPSDTEE